ncbi:MAG: recombination protein RecR [Planctomycetes bacterium]|nr:recombination protein RecR [Planctomycetota bacterium]
MECLARLPGVGAKTSERFAYHLLRAPEAEALDLAHAIRAARERTKVCSECCNLDEVDPCAICADPARDRGLLLVVEDPRDIASFEGAGHRGLYHVLQGRVSSVEGIAPEDLTVAALVARVRRTQPREVCLATNPDLEGEGTAQWIGARLRELGVTVTRLARGMPAGANIHQVSTSILADAMAGRRPLP